MGRGRKPQPTILKVLRGNPHTHGGPVTSQEPQHAPLDVAHIPPELKAVPIARAEWVRLVPGLVETGHVTMADRAVFIAYCLKYAQWRALEAAARNAPPTVDRRTGSPMINPILTLTNDLAQLVIRLAAELGLTPSSRARVQAVPPKPAVSKWAGALK